MKTDVTMICPKCNTEMNFHALKVDYTDSLETVFAMPRECGGILEEFHSCPSCGETATREHVIGA